ncbi:MAG TPA: exostosin family protein [Brevefilum sp.]|nr:exostosin family protein [Brevefilum sp.]HOR20037.1 exostosin family protein [Brevefilum sp.]HPL69857.1 exostosin family protein [Brevefilum sp.]
MIKFFSNSGNYRLEDRYHLNTPAKALWSNRSPEERRQVYGKWVDFFTYEPGLTRADICILTYHWSYYVHHDKVSEAQAEVNAAHQHGKPTVVFSGGDYPANLPFEDVTLFESAGYRSTSGLRYHSAQPSYIPDYLHLYSGGQFQPRPKREVPIVGFCGQASTSPVQTAFRALRLEWQRRQHRRGVFPWQPPPFETSSFRTRVLRAFAHQPGIETNFIPRRRYHAGENKDKSHQHPSKVEFVNNILGSDYTLCMRGGGNFSVRFYETLCLGRIPIFIDTDCLLPFQDEIDYKSFFPWIDLQDLPHATEILLDFHSKLSNEKFINLQRMCRELWLNHMTPDGFYRDLHHKLQTWVEK